MKIHIVGIGGIAMGNLAKMLKDSGYVVTGSDQNLYPPMSIRLLEWGFSVRNFSKDNIVDVYGHPKADLYIVGNVISRGNIEVETILDYSLPLMSMPQALYEFFLKKKKVIVIAGTHGKTTTTFLVHSILEYAGLQPGLFVGGIRSDGFPGYQIGNGEYFIIEGDEYDTAFFDKQPKFLHYRPYHLILTSIEFDHADIYEDLKQYERSFELLLRWIPQKGKIIANYDSPLIRKLLTSHSNVIYFSRKIQNISNKNQVYKVLFEKNQNLFLPFGKVKSPIFGIHNYANILASALLTRELNIDTSLILKAIETFPGVLRRQYLRKKIYLQDIEVEFYEDFAHHPTAIFETIQAFKHTFPDGFLIACYEPRSATSHRNVFQEEYPESFLKADAIYITEVYNPEKVPQKYRLNVKKIIEDIKNFQSEAYYCKNPDELLKALQKHFHRYLLLAKKNQQNKLILLCMSNGEFGNIYTDIEEWLQNLETKKRIDTNSK